MTHVAGLLLVLSLAASVSVAQSGGDVDQDGIPDALEHELLARFTPLLRFSNDGGEEQYRPMDAIQYITWSELQSVGDEGQGVLLDNAALKDPRRLLSMGTDVTSTPAFRNTDRYLHPLADVPHKGGNWARYGYAWNDVMANRNVGLYGHVVPFVAKAPQTDFLMCEQRIQPQGRDRVLCTIDAGRAPGRYYKVEYWQFFGYNGVGKPFDLGDHEGDWCSVQLIIDAANLAIVQVHHFFHGHIAAFDLRKFPTWVPLLGNNVREYRGPSWPAQVNLTWHKGADAQNNEADRFAQNNVVQLAADPLTGLFTHPVVYVEHGGHEFWPTAAWSFQDSPSHNGDDRAHTYFASAPPNLGEVEHPLQETPYADVILRYNGRWGAYAKRNDPAQGPALHSNWTWPAQSSVRWQLPKDLGF